MIIADGVLIVCLCIWGLLILLLTYALITYRSPQSSGMPFVSVVIAARNEERSIADCLSSLAAQSYPQEAFEVILINDRSEDRTRAAAEPFSQIIKNFQIIDIVFLADKLSPKKNALNEGIKAARGEIILCTDADCRARKGWIQSMAACFDEQTGMVVGYSPIIPNNKLSILEQFVSLDSLALASLAAASTYWNRTLTATGRNLSYRKTVFNEVGGFRKIGHFISGDDDLLLGLFRKTRWNIAYCMDANAQVETGPPESFHQFINQKIRQASKSRHYDHAKRSLIAGLYLFHVAILFYPVFAVIFKSGLSFNIYTLVMVFWPWIAKMLLDFILMLTGAIRFRRISFLPFYPIISILHPLYIVVFGLWGLFGKFEWKERKFSTTI